MYGNNQYGGFTPQQQSTGIDINIVVKRLAELKNAGANPNAVFGQIMQDNPAMQGMQQQFMNMGKGKNQREFVLQLAKQSGATPETLQTISQML